MSEEVPHKIRRLSRDFTRDISNDGAKKFLILGNMILKCLALWPDRDAWYITAFNWYILFNVILAVITLGSFIVLHITDYTTSILVSVSVTASLEFTVRCYTLICKKAVINKILLNIWTEYWPLSVLSPKKVKRYSGVCKLVFNLVVGCHFFGTLYNSYVTFTPLIASKELVVKMSFPFEWYQNFVYELLYAWQFFISWYALILINGFDSLMIVAVVVSAMQFAIMQNVIKNIYNEKGERQRKYLYKEDITTEDMFKKWLDQHRMLIDTCNKLEEVFGLSVLTQFFTSTTALCASTVILKVDPSQFFQMSAYALAHLFQLFHYCFAGNELTLQSEKMANAVYSCNWQISPDIKFKKALVLVLQRCQIPQLLTGAGVIDLNFPNYIAVLRLCFSFYTLLTDIIAAKIEAEESQ